MNRVVVQYRVKPAMVEENERLVKEVYRQLHENKPTGFRYATYKMPDGVTFMHVAVSEAADGSSPLSALPAFKNFQAAIKDRCDEMPVVKHVEEIESYF